MRKLRLALPTLTAALLVCGCNPRANDDASAVSINCAFENSNDSGGIGNYSDVVNNDGSVSDDQFTVTVHSDIKNNSSTPGAFYRVNFQGVIISYSRVDGRNVPGQDVPFPIAYSIGGIVEPEGTTDITTIFVTEEMKRQPPLRNLWFGEGQRIFATLTVTIYGVDQVGNEVRTTCSQAVIFQDL